MLRAFGASLRAAGTGLLVTVIGERNMRIHFVIFALVLAFQLVVRPATPVSIAVLLVSAMVLGLELMNTAVEAVVDLVTKGDYNPLAGVAKDAAAASVLVAASVSLLVAAYLFYKTWPWHWLLFSRVHLFGAVLNAVALVLCFTFIAYSLVMDHKTGNRRKPENHRR